LEKAFLLYKKQLTSQHEGLTYQTA